MKKQISSIFIAFLLIICPFFFTACGDGGDPTISSIEIIGDVKTTYYVGEELNIEGLQVKIIKSDDSSSTITLTSDMVSGFDSSTAGTKTLTVTYNEKTATVEYIVTTAPVSSISVSSTFKSIYYTGDSIDLSDGKILVTYETGSTETIDITEAMVSGFDTTSAGESKTLTISYGEKTTTVTYKVTQLTITQISLLNGFKSNYFVGDSLDVSGGKITVTYNSGKTESVNITASMVSNFSTTSACSAIATITYEGKTCNHNYTVTAIAVSSIQLETPSTFKTNYFVGDSVDASGSKLLVTYNNDTSKTEVIDEDTMISNFNTTTAGENKTLTISYGGKTTTASYNVIEIVAVSLKIINEFKTDYLIDETLDLSNGTIEVVFNNDSKTTIPVSNASVLGFDSQFEGTFTLTISYGGISITTNYTVSRLKVVKVELISSFKSTYYKGQTLDVTGGVIKATYNDGSTEEINVTLDMLKSKSTSNAKTYTTTIVTDYYNENNEAYTIPFTYTVLNRTIVLADGVETTFNVGDSFTGTVTVTYYKADGSVDYSENIDVTENMLSNFNTTSTGIKYMTISYDGISALIEYTVVE